ncbi:GPP34 family phosphoprotein [Corynebacterium timonense]|uniref:Golgi phosphoprotein 3 (GPP34) n=1 Tax=Corynebacterium timonense TaxID=441500 RepID=A0A1H1S3L9_9CORY|nr:GPP34 family phosphoprotein [Corynebacterium timonense]SDS42597.1 Golgi phosphoprotein 3 (GPP34) [Corynebacterium timonense]
MLIVENLFLLFTRDNGRVNVGIPNQDKALNAGLFSDLVLAGVVTVDQSNHFRESLIRVLESAPVANVDPELIVAGYKALCENPGATVESLLHASWFVTRNQIARSLANQGVVTIGRDKFFGIELEKYPTIDRRPEEELRERLASMLRGEEASTVQEALTLVLLAEVGNIKLELREQLSGVSVLDIKTRVRELAEEHLTPVDERTIKAVRRAVDSMVSVLSGSALFMS